jgi:hypothetical protein
MKPIRLRITQERQARFRLAIVLVAVLAAAACVPTIALEEYRKNFSVVRATATDLNIQAEFYAKELADDPRSADPPSVRAEKYTQRLQAIEFRHNALRLVDQYNDVLVALASGSDPKAVEGSLGSIKNGLEALQIEQLTSAISSVVPYIGVISQGIALIDDALKARKFKTAVASAGEPLIGILTILDDDADSIQAIVDARLERVYNQSRALVADARFRFRAIADNFSDTPAITDPSVPTMARLQKRLDNLLGALALWPGESPLLPLERTPGRSRPDPTAISSLSAMVDQVKTHINVANRAVSARTAHAGYIAAYKAALKTTAKNFAHLNAAIEEERSVGIIQFTKQALELRKAYLKVRRETI